MAVEQPVHHPSRPAGFPLISRRLALAGANVIAVPSCTDGLAGCHRVKVASLARALENQCYVAQAPTVGIAPWSIAVDENVGAAGVFAPCSSRSSTSRVWRRCAAMGRSSGIAIGAMRHTSRMPHLQSTRCGNSLVWMPAWQGEPVTCSPALAGDN